MQNLKNNVPSLLPHLAQDIEHSSLLEAPWGHFPVNRPTPKYHLPSGPHLKVIVFHHTRDTCHNWLLVERDPGCFSRSSNTENRSPTTENHPAPNVNGLQLGKVGSPDSIDYLHLSLNVIEWDHTVASLCLGLLLNIMSWDSSGTKALHKFLDHPFSLPHHIPLCKYVITFHLPVDGHLAGALGCPGSENHECVSLGGNKCPFPLGINPGMELVGWDNLTLINRSVLAKAQGILHKNPVFWLLLKNLFWQPRAWLCTW